uniref:Uncharacterized protein n=1 Tax=Ascaris lumbricoides TaxID=6252 RepID=A0A9J2PWS1_ASCLU
MMGALTKTKWMQISKKKKRPRDGTCENHIGPLSETFLQAYKRSSVSLERNPSNDDKFDDNLTQVGVQIFRTLLSIRYETLRKEQTPIAISTVCKTALSIQHAENGSRIKYREVMVVLSSFFFGVC